MKRIVALVLCMILMVSLIAGCGKDKKKAGGTITIGICVSALIEDYDTNAFTTWVEEQTGYNIEFEFFSTQSSEAKTQIATRIAAGETLPDIIMGVNFGREVYTEYGQDGYFLDLKEYFDDKEGVAKNFWDAYSKLPKYDQDRALRSMTDPKTGAMYVVPTLQYSEIDVMDSMMFINQDWLTKLGLKMPTNLEEFYNVLVAFRDRDPNGNGQKDEIPLIGSTGLSSDIVSYLINQFVYYNDAKQFNVQKGKLTTPFTSNEYREAMKYINKLVNENILSSQSLTLSQANLKGYICPPAAGGKVDESQIRVGCFAGHPTICIENENPAFLKYKAMNYWNRCIVTDNLSDYTTFITEDCKNPEKAWDLLMFLFTDDAATRMRYGEKGVDWDDADKGTKSFIGKDAEIKVINPVWGNTNNSTWGTIKSTVLYYAENEVTQVEDVSSWRKYLNEQFTTLHDNYLAAAEKYNPKEKVTSIVYTTDETDKYQMTMDNCKAYITNSRTAFITGTMNPNSDSDWNSYLKKLDELGLQEWKNVAQAAYDRQK